ncbi:hypothetical protein CYLTODRAFT_446091 [Cylindrobasidium torrendii FP15055 ss-10]|uniref:MYND-type domain-containing protein n=1 Tax=Cylindrobasidium torrendii FP15055 ss-10 TaxID=1314674 RepID=A0A0D7B467_9AGAR|nr:hypothetical protein CYLTODRAFT_446091 [Cylindrobasidium torrendii FP15055 ss-10]
MVFVDKDNGPRPVDRGTIAALTMSSQEHGKHPSKMESIKTVEELNSADMPHPAGIASFVDVLSPLGMVPVCSGYFTEFHDLFTSTPEVTNELRRSHPEIFSAALQFIARPRTHQEILAYGNMLVVCNCPHDPTLGAAHSKIATATMAGERFFDNLCGIVLAGLGVYEPSIESLSKVVTLDDLVKESKQTFKRTGRTTWPSEHVDIFPAEEPSQVVCMLWRIFNAFPKTEKPLYLFLVLWKLSYATVFRLVYRIEDGRWPEQLIGHADRAFDYGGRAKNELHTHILLSLLMDVALSHGRYLDMVNILIWSEHNLDVTRFASRLLLSDAFKDLANDQTTFLSRLGAMFWEIAYKVPLLHGATADFSKEERASLSPRIDAPKLPSLTACLQLNQANIDIATARERTCASLISTVRSEACAAPECFETTATKNHSLLICGRCHLALYCSRECQKAAWKHSEFPHKPMCHGLLKKLNEKLEVDWKQIRAPEQQNALHERSKYLSLQDCRDVEMWLYKSVSWKGYERAFRVQDSEGYTDLSASPLALWNVWMDSWDSPIFEI